MRLERYPTQARAHGLQDLQRRRGPPGLLKSTRLVADSGVRGGAAPNDVNLDEYDRLARETLLGRLREDPRLSSHDIAVDVRRGVAVLTGVVDSFRRRVAALDLAAQVSGIDLVEDHLRVQPTGEITDGDLASEVRSMLTHDREIGAEAVLVSAHAGRVVLEGTVSNESQRRHAEDLALSATGVHKVTNQLVVAGEARMEATVIARELQQELLEDPRLEGCFLRLSISGDRAVLSGRANSEAQVAVALEVVRRAWKGSLEHDVRYAR